MLNVDVVRMQEIGRAFRKSRHFDEWTGPIVHSLRMRYHDLADFCGVFTNCVLLVEVWECDFVRERPEVQGSEGSKLKKHPGTCGRKSDLLTLRKL